MLEFMFSPYLTTKEKIGGLLGGIAIAICVLFVLYIGSFFSPEFSASLISKISPTMAFIILMVGVVMGLIGEKMIVAEEKRNKRRY